jgi:hypothetical protein
MRSPSRQTTHSRFLLAAAIVCAVMAVLSMWLGRARSEQTALPAPFRLSDGSRITLEALTFGTQHTCQINRSPWHLLRPLLFWRRGSRAPGLFTHTTATDTVVAWVTRRDADGRRFRDFTAVDGLAVVDEHGCLLTEDDQAGSWLEIDREDSSGLFYNVARAELPLFPPYGRPYTLRVLDDHWRCIGTLRGTSPIPARTVDLKPEALPITRRAGGIDWTLTRLQVRRVQRPNEAIHGAIRVSATFTAKQKGRPLDAWEVDAGHLTLRDTRCNTLPIGTIRKQTENTWEFGGLCPFEPAWGLKVRFFLTTPPPGARWDLSGIPLPKPEEFHRVARSRLVAGVTLEVIGIAGPGTFTYEDGVLTSARAIPTTEAFSMRMSGSEEAVIAASQPHLVLAVRGLGSTQRFTLTIRDDQGRRVREGASSSTGDYRYHLLHTPADARAIALTLAVHQGHEAEFPFRPPTP